MHRARLNGIDDAGMYYDQAVLFVLRGEHQQALASFEEAYERGWRQSWFLRMDHRLDPLREHPRFIEFSQRIEDAVDRARAEIRNLKVARL